MIKRYQFITIITFDNASSTITAIKKNKYLIDFQSVSLDPSCYIPLYLFFSSKAYSQKAKRVCLRPFSQDIFS